MKKIFFIAITCMSCNFNRTAIEQLETIDKPIVVFSVHKRMNFFDVPEMTVKDGKGRLIELESYHLDQLTAKYQVGDTIK